MTQTENAERVAAADKPLRGNTRTKKNGRRASAPKNEKITVSRPKKERRQAAPKPTGNTPRGRKKAGRPAPRTKATQNLVIGGEPRVDLLPLEIRNLAVAKKTRGRLGLAIIALIVLVVAGSGGAALFALQSSSNLTLAQAETQTLLAQQQKYISVRTVQADVSKVEAARRIGASTEIDWKSYLIAVQKTLPSNVTIDTVKIDSASPLATYAQPTAPLQGARVATLSFAATSPTLPKVPTWLTGLQALPGFADALPGSLTKNDNGSYTVDITMHINDHAYSNRFAKKEK